MNAGVTAIILAGGRGTRMGGIDKGLMDFDGAPIITRVIDRIGPQVDRLLISANRNLDRYHSMGYPVYRDQIGDFQGPLAGIISAGAHAESPLLLTAPCDMPALPPDLRYRLQQDLTESNSDITIAHDGERSQQLCMLFRTDLLSDMKTYLQSGKRSVIGWVERHRHTATDFSYSKNAFLNINRPT